MRHRSTDDEEYAYYINKILETLKKERGQWTVSPYSFNLTPIRKGTACLITSIWGRPGYKPSCYYYIVAKEVGMPPELADFIAKASDVNTFTGLSCADTLKLLRELMLDAAGLEEQ